MSVRVLISAGMPLFESFFSATLRTHMGQIVDYEIDESKSITPAFRKKLGDTDALITTWDSPAFSTELLRMAPNLRMIAHCGGEVKTRFSPSLFRKLTITNAPAPMARATAELGAAFLAYCARDIDSYRTRMREASNRVYAEAHTWGTGESIYGREVAMIGFGRVARALVDLMRGFDLRWTVYDPYAPRSLASQYPVVFSQLKPLLRRAELLVLTAALTDRTRGILDRKALGLLPDGAFIINIARGGLLDLAALTHQVRTKRLRCALDVTDPLEPLPVRHPLRKMPGAIVTPHIAGGGRHVREEIARTVVDDLESFFRQNSVKNRVTTAMLKRMT